MVGGVFGLDWKITVSSVLTTVAKVEKVSFPEIGLVIDEITSHDSAGGWPEFLAVGLKEVSMLEVEVIWNPADATHAELLTLSGTGAENAMTLADSDDGETFAFNALVPSISRMMDDSKKGRRAKIKIRTTGQITIS